MKSLKLASVSKLSFCMVLSCLLLIGCASQSSKKANTKIAVNNQMINSSDMAFWIVFAVSKPSCGEDYQVYSYGEFACAFKMASLVTNLSDEDKSADTGDAPPNQFQIERKKISNAGFLNEYIFYYYNQNHWFQEPGLKTSSFNTWMKNNLPNHKPSQQAVSVKSEKKQDNSGSIPQIGLPDNLLGSVGNLYFIGVHQYDKAELGLSVRYDIVGKKNGWIDFYIYPILLSKKGLKKRNGFVDEASSAKSGIIYYAQKEKAETMDIIKEISNKEQTFLNGQYEIVRNGTHYIEDLYLSGNEKYFLKARSTYIKGERNFEESDIKEIFANILNNIYLEKTNESSR